MHQLREIDEPHAQFLKPLIVAKQFNKNWNKYTSGLSQEEIADLEQARNTLAHYDKIYSLYEYATDLHANMWMLEIRISANNPSVPLNIYRASKSVKEEAIWPEILQCIQAYYDLIDDCAEYPEWQRKVIKDLGGTVSYLALTMEESCRDTLVSSPIYARFDMEKQIYFK